MRQNFAETESLGWRKTFLNTVNFFKVLDKVCPTFVLFHDINES
jgi:hypothetical protein